MSNPGIYKILNKSHAIERAYRNWKGAKVEALPEKYKFIPVEGNPFE